MHFEQNVTQSIVVSGTAARRGACPTLSEPMPTGDGLLARIRVAGKVMTARQLAELAALADRWGNGLVEVTARGNMQVRGLKSEAVRPFADAVGALLSIETGLVVDTSPIAGDDPEEKADSRSVAADIRAAAAKFTGKLGPKVSVVVDGNGQISLASLKADIRLEARDSGSWAVTLGGGQAQVMDPGGAVAATLAVLGALAAIGPQSRASDLFPDGGAPAGDTFPVVRTFNLQHGTSSGIGLPFGAMDGKHLTRLAQAASAGGVSIFRLAPGHGLLLDGADTALIAEANRLGFVTDSADPRQRVSACIGNRGCASGHIAARELASSLAAHTGPGHLHVSGCAKGCAHPRRAHMTLVGSEGGIGLVIDGRAGDTPSQILDEAGVKAVLGAWQDGR
ncbi:MAG: hypothetical protein ABS75_26695 [Pelagibacterium sp. SCN 63-23]|nr:MAG: hypothetical protein ABS75_26695 [Pelagibacterium sp. SCN 63-23]